MSEFLKDDSVVRVYLPIDKTDEASRGELRLDADRSSDAAGVFLANEMSVSEQGHNSGKSDASNVADGGMPKTIVVDDEDIADADDDVDADTDTDADIDTDTDTGAIPVVNPRRTPRVNPVDLNAEVDRYGAYQDAARSSHSSNTLGMGLVLLLFAIALIVALWVAFGFVAEQAKEQGAQTLRDSIMDAAMQCFAIEGCYPPSLEYLQENYGLSVNEDDYTVVYVAFASNVPPSVDVRMR